MKFMIFALCCLFCCSIWLVECQPSDLVAPIVDYKRGNKDRVEYVKAVIKKEHLDTGSAPNAETRAYSKKMSGFPSGDDAGHCIAQRLGGTGKKTYNIVPQNLSKNRGLWRTRVEKPIYDDVNAGNEVTYEVWPRYEKSDDTRPNKLDYKAVRKGGQVVVDGSMENPKP